MRDKTKFLANIIDWAKTKEDPTLLLFIDADKAIDRLDWGFLKDLISKMGFGPSFQQWVNLNLWSKCFSLLVFLGRTHVDTIL